MALPALNESLSYGRIPLNFCHQRERLRHYFTPNWTKLTEIENWDIIDLRSMSTRTNCIRLVDPEITFTTSTERISLTYYYKAKGRIISVPNFIVRDNHNGYIYLPRDCFVAS